MFAIFCQKESGRNYTGTDFFFLPVGEGSPLVEAGSYIGVPETINSAVVNMLGTFKMLS
jgi:hypothetical protein